MRQPEYILEAGTRVRTHETMDDTRGMLIAPKHLKNRKPNAVGAICGIVGGHGGDVYWVAHVGDNEMAAYGWWEFELEPAKDPCPSCNGSGFDWKVSHESHHGTACTDCGGTAEKTDRPPKLSAYQRLRKNVEEIK